MAWEDKESLIWLVLNNGAPKYLFEGEHFPGFEGVIH